jgi:hypothetical protein
MGKQGRETNEVALSAGGSRRSSRGRPTRSLCATLVAVAAACALVAAPALAATAGGKPTATTGAASSLTYESAQLAATVNPGDESTEVYFQYGTTNTYGYQSAPTQLPAGKATVPVSIAISGLAAGTTYHFRIVATNATATSLGLDKSFQTAKIPLSLAITAAPNPVGFGGAVTIEGTLSGTGNSGVAVQLQQSPFPYTAAFADVGNPELTLSGGSFSFNVLALTLNTEFRVVSGTVSSSSVLVSDSLAVTLNAKPTGTKKRPTVRFTGKIAPGEPSARIAFERLEGTNWKVIGGTVAGAAVVNGLVSFAATVRIHFTGFFRALVLPVEGAHVSGYSPTVSVRIK